MRVSMQATYGITDIAYNYRPIMGGEAVSYTHLDVYKRQ